MSVLLGDVVLTIYIAVPFSAEPSGKGRCRLYQSIRVSENGSQSAADHGGPAEGSCVEFSLGLCARLVDLGAWGDAAAGLWLEPVVATEALLDLSLAEPRTPLQAQALQQQASSGPGLRPMGCPARNSLLG